MEDEHRKRLSNRLAPMHLYKLTPKTNCGECGVPTCLAFATQTIIGQIDIDACPYLDKDALGPFRAQLAEQQRHGIGVKREGWTKALQHLRGEMGKCNLRSIVDSLGGEMTGHEGREAVKLVYFGREIVASADDVFAVGGEELNPWEKIFLYNYTIGGAVEPSGSWVGMESLPNSVSKVKSLKAHCEEPLARAFAGKMDLLPEAVAGVGRVLDLVDEKVDFAAEIKVLPRLSIRIHWWDEDVAEGFPATVKIVFDSRVMQVLDLESLIFACEQVTERLVEKAKGR